jgi:anti-sigma regulatory factor (Ser/Thr protein kinase)
MTDPGIDTLRGSACARSGGAAQSSVEPAVRLSPELARMQEWPLISHVELRALPPSVRSARLITRSILHGWCLEGLAETAELLVSELITNAVRASTSIVHRKREIGLASPTPMLRFWLTSDSRSVLIRVWDSANCGPVRKAVGPAAEAGRGLLLIETLSAQWGWYTTEGQDGKVVWAVCSESP